MFLFLKKDYKQNRNVKEFFSPSGTIVIYYVVIIIISNQRQLYGVATFSFDSYLKISIDVLTLLK